MYSKKIFFTVFTVPALLLSHGAYEYQMRRKVEKLIETKRRLELMNQQPIDITPKDKKFIWSKVKQIDEFEKEFAMKPVQIRGIFDHQKELRVDKLNYGEKGQEVITPFYTHLNEKGEECGILVNRGWIPCDLENLRMHYMGATSGTITGILYRGDLKNKYSIPNEPTVDQYYRADPKDFATVMQMNNKEEASQFMLMQVDLDDNHRQILPTVPNRKDLVEFRITPDRHNAYALLWKYITFGGVFANTMVWLYF